MMRATASLRTTAAAAAATTTTTTPTLQRLLSSSSSSSSSSAAAAGAADDAKKPAAPKKDKLPPASAVPPGAAGKPLLEQAPPINYVSRNITQPKRQGASQAMLYAVGLTEKDMSKAQVGISSVWWEGNPCNAHLLDLSEEVKKGVERAGLVGLRFNTIGVSDGISMGTRGMGYSLQSRDLIADSIETVMSAQWYDANISIPGCDKNMPGCLMGTCACTSLVLPSSLVILSLF